MFKLEMGIDTIEMLINSAEQHGKRSDLLKEVTRLKNISPSTKLETIYEEAYCNTLNT